MAKKEKIICLMGPTASGKTPLAIELAQVFPFDIISVDSAMVYRGMDIGTAKPSPDILKNIPHQLIDIRDPVETYSAGQFREDALNEIAKSHANHRIPFLVGGTMMYFRILQQGLANMPSADESVRAQLQLEAETKGWLYLHEKLSQVDPKAASRIHPNDTQRIQRALEVFYTTQKTITEWQEAETNPLAHYDFHYLIISPAERSTLHQRIAERFTQMLQQGFLDEVDQLRKRSDLSLDSPSMRSVGYRQAWEYLAGTISYQALQETAIAATRQLAKRQLTWLRSWHDASWFESDAPGLVEAVKEAVKSFQD